MLIWNLPVGIALFCRGVDDALFEVSKTPQLTKSKAMRPLDGMVLVVGIRNQGAAFRLTWNLGDSFPSLYMLANIYSGAIIKGNRFPSWQESILVNSFTAILSHLTYPSISQGPSSH